MKTFFDGLPRCAAIAHRGGARTYPENTLVGFERALTLHGMDVLELDVQCTRDGVLVVAHDPTVERCTDGTGAIASFSLDELKRLDAGARFPGWKGKGVTIPTLEELLAAFPRARLNIELKPECAGREAQFVETLAKHSALGRVCIGSEDDAVGAKVSLLTPQTAHFYSAEAALQLAQGVWGVAPLEADPRYDVLAVPMRYGGEVVTTATFFAACAKLSVPVFVWVVDEAEDMRALLRDGAAGVMTDLPAVLHEVLR
ncbi:MAG: glycerophosphodiester phosphodiesterase [Archangiaceae bacterium]|nr:glycerophosphodiester phosphodiesterase [Archangiaceae bacterium]